MDDIDDTRTTLGTVVPKMCEFNPAKIAIFVLHSKKKVSHHLLGQKCSESIWKLFSALPNPGSNTWKVVLAIQCIRILDKQGMREVKALELCNSDIQLVCLPNFFSE